MNVMRSWPPEYSARGMMRRYHMWKWFVLQMILLIPWNIISRHVRAVLKSRCCLLGVRTKAMAVEVPADFAHMEKLAEVSDVAISCFDDMVAALRKRHDFSRNKDVNCLTTELKNSMPRIIQDAEVKGYL